MRERPTHCINGHEFTPENTYVWPKTGKRVCRACQRERSYRSYVGKANARKAAHQRELEARYPAPSDIELAWAAGLFEGEGTVTINSGGREGYTRSFVTVTNTDRQVVDFFHARWGGCLQRVLKASPRSPNARDCYVWSLNGSAHIALFVTQVLPFIQTARVRRKMELVLEAHAAREQGSRDPDYKARCAEYMTRMRELNRRGIH